MEERKIAGVKVALLPKGMIEEAARRFRLLGDPSRLELLNILSAAGELSVHEIVEASGQSQSNVSRHLGLLNQADIVARRRDGMQVYYRINDPSLSGMCLLMFGQLKQEGV